MGGSRHRPPHGAIGARARLQPSAARSCEPNSAWQSNLGVPASSAGYGRMAWRNWPTSTRAGIARAARVLAFAESS